MDGVAKARGGLPAREQKGGQQRTGQEAGEEEREESVHSLGF